MSATKILIAAAVAAILSTLACAKPRHIRSNDQSNKNEIKPMALKDVQTNNTVCPIEVHYDVNEERVPRRIKILKCAEQPRHCSEKHNITDFAAHECCNLKYNNRHLACVEITDRVLVFYKDNKNQTMDVSVGCSCMIQVEKEGQNITGHA